MYSVQEKVWSIKNDFMDKVGCLQRRRGSGMDSGREHEWTKMQKMA